jgi:release factor glutamine methyltransferase
MERVRDALARAAGALAAAGIEAPRREARLLLCHALGCSPAALLAMPDQPAPPGFDALLARRVAREPLAYITGRAEFWSLPIIVSPASLIPRADSETLIEAALAAFPDCARVGRVLDLGTGTGCLLLAALREFPGAFGVGVDIAPEAAALAAANAAALGLLGRAAFLTGNWAAALRARFDLVLANPPYVARGEIGGLMAEVALHEPARALDGGADGLAAYRALLADLPRLLMQGGAAVFELGMGQADRVAALARGHGFYAETRPDLAGIPRAIILRAALS